MFSNIEEIAHFQGDLFSVNGVIKKTIPTENPLNTDESFE